MLLLRHISDDFDGWAALASSDPERFEALRQSLIDTAIGRAPSERQEQLRALQWRIDQERERSDNPIAACVSIQRMMWEKVSGDNGLLDRLKGIRNLRPQAKVVHLNRR